MALTNDFDKAFRDKGCPLICGVDEAGRGPLAGPVVAAAVIFRDGEAPEGLNDSKKLSEKKREQLFDEICDKALYYAVCEGSLEEIESLNILQATFLAMRRAVGALSVTPNLILVDGNQTPPDMPAPVHTVIKGDAQSQSIAAASILAKVTRDRQMKAYAQQYPAYGFDKHKGYGTKAHYEALDENGLSPIHRRSFLKKYLQEK